MMCSNEMSNCSWSLLSVKVTLYTEALRLILALPWGKNKLESCIMENRKGIIALKIC